MPCNYKEYKFVKSSSNPLSIPSSVAFWAASSKTQIEEEVLLYPFTSLIAEFGGSLGLFLGFSFLAIWQEIRGYFCTASDDEFDKNLKFNMPVLQFNTAYFDNVNYVS